MIAIDVQDRNGRSGESFPLPAERMKQTEEEPTAVVALRISPRYLWLALIAVAVIIGTSVFNVISLKMEEAHAKAELSALEAEKKALQEELSVVDSKEYIEQQAREQLRMIQPGETLYVLKKREKAEDETAN